MATGPASADRDVFYTAADGSVWFKPAVSGTPANPAGGDLGQVLSGTGPAAVGRGTSIYVLVTGTDHELYINQSGVAGFPPAGGMTSSGPALVNVTNALVGYAHGTDNAGYYHEFLSTTPGWHSLDGNLTSGMGGASWGATPWGYALGTDGQVYENDDLGTTWFMVTP